MLKSWQIFVYINLHRTHLPSFWINHTLCKRSEIYLEFLCKCIFYLCCFFLLNYLSFHQFQILTSYRTWIQTNVTSVECSQSFPYRFEYTYIREVFSGKAQNIIIQEINRKWSFYLLFNHPGETRKWWVTWQIMRLINLWNIYSITGKRLVNDRR